MRLLLDTHVLHDVLFKPERLPPRVRAAIVDPANQVLVSAISPYELEVKKAIGKISLPHIADWASAIKRDGFEILDIAVAHGATAARLPLHHRDPWDRLLLAQAQLEALALVTDDGVFAAYGVPTLW